MTTTPAPTAAPSARRGRRRAEDVAGLGKLGAGAFVTPALVLIGLFLLFPALWTVYLGMTNYRLTGLAARNPKFVGFDNFSYALTDPSFWNSIKLTLVFVLLSGVIGQTLLGFSIAWLLRHLKGWVRAVVETLVLAAWVVPSSVSAFLWLALLDRRDGTLNALLGTQGSAWLVDHAMACIVIFNIWVGTAFSMQLFSSAIASVPPSQLETSSMVGANTWQVLRDVVLPNIKGHVLTNTLLITLWTFNTFTPYLLTAGGPDRDTDIMSVYIYRTAIPGGQLGRGAAISLIMLVINLVIALGYMRVSRGRKGSR